MSASQPRKFFPSFSPQLQLETLFVLDNEGHIRCTREPHPQDGPAFFLVRDMRACAWAVNASVPLELAKQVEALARDEPPADELIQPPRHADGYVALLGERVDAGPVFTFSNTLEKRDTVVVITAITELNYHFRGWTADEIPDRSPIVGIVEDGHVVSVCFCARRSEFAAEAGVETAVGFRGRGFAPRVTAEWARVIQDSGRLPIYSTSWNNRGSLAVAQKLGLSACAADWSVDARAV
jgi:hypothetical protein